MRKVMITLAAAALSFAGTDAFAETIDGEVIKINPEAGKITIKHGPWKSQHMPTGMTMTFRAEDPAMLKPLKPGDKIKFEAKEAGGQLTVTKIDLAK